MVGLRINLPYASERTTYLDGRFLFAVAQLPFEAGENQFCTLVPIWNSDGMAVDVKQDFPNRQLCWIWLRDAKLQELSPGQLVFGAVERSNYHGTSAPDKDWWQIRLDTAIQAGERGSVLEIVHCAAGASEDPRTLIDPSRTFDIGHRPSALVLVTLGDFLYGPFRARPRRGVNSVEAWPFTLERTSQVQLWRVARGILRQRSWIVTLPEIHVAFEQTVPAEASRVKSIAYTFMPWDNFEQLGSIGAEQISLVTDAEILIKAAREHLPSKKKRQDLKYLLDELSENLRSVPEAAGSLAIAARVSASLALSAREAVELTDALLTSGVLDSQIEAATRTSFQDYLVANAASAQANISASVADKQQTLDLLDAEIASYTDLLQQERTKARTALGLELKAQREVADAALAKDRQMLDEQSQRLQRERQTLAQTVERASMRFTQGRDELVSDVLALLPALQATGILQVSRAEPASAGSSGPANTPSPLPSAFQVRREEPTERPNELAFFKRFAEHVGNEGFSYRDVDLRAFHLLVKCGDLTVLGGLSGTGKSSLVRLYAEALAGEDEDARKRLLTVDVSPSWTEPQDILGTVNLLDRRFEPAPSGLFSHIIQASREYDQVGNQAGMVLVTLDEMNLAQVEHYLTGIFQALERPPPRHVPVFDPSALQADDPLRAFASLSLPPSLRLIGTVNLDETTRPLSQRLKDRTAILELGSMRLQQQQQRPGTSVVPGPTVLLADMHAWMTPRSRLPQEFATEVGGLMDRLHPPLMSLGAPITQRRTRAIDALLAAGGDLMRPEQVLDVAIATRVLPMLRGLDRPAARDHAKNLRTLLSDAPGGCPDSVRRLGIMLDEAEAEWRGLDDE